MENDLTFIDNMRLYLFEHQSTINPNMPLRFLQHVSAEYEKLTIQGNLHKRKLVKVSNPHFVAIMAWRSVRRA